MANEDAGDAWVRRQVDLSPMQIRKIYLVRVQEHVESEEERLIRIESLIEYAQGQPSRIPNTAASKGK